MANDVVPLSRKNMDFRWTPEADIYIYEKYARFVPPLQISVSMMEDMAQHLKKDVERHGADPVRKYLYARIWRMSPKGLKVRPKYQEVFDEARKEYLDSVNVCYLSHRRNRMQELDELYTILMNRFLDAVKNGEEVRQDLNAMISLLKEARAEMASSNVEIEASVVDGDATFAMRSNVQNLSESQIKELMSKHERGESIELPADGGNGAEPSRSVLPSPGAGTTETESGSGRTA